MGDAPSLLLLTSRSISRHQIVYGGICLDAQPNWKRLEEGWRAWLLGREPLEVVLVYHQVVQVHLSGMGWMHDGHIVKKTGDQQTMTELASNGVTSVKFSPPLDTPLPALLGTDPAWEPRRVDLRVQMRAQRMIDLPDAAAEVERLESMFHSRETRAKFAAAPLFAGLAFPVEVGDGPAARGVLYLREALNSGIFEATLYLSDKSVAIESGTVLSRRCQRDLPDRMIRHEAEVGTVMSVEDAGPLEPEQPGTGIVRAGRDGGDFPITCSDCGAAFSPQQFTPEQIEVIDLWGWLYPMEKERSLVERTLSLFRRNAEAKGSVRTKLDAILHSPEARRAFIGSNKTLGEMPDPRPANYSEQLAEWTKGDPGLREFLSTDSCSDWAARLEFVREAVAKWERKLAGRCVVCPQCHAGMVCMRTSVPLHRAATPPPPCTP